MFLRLALIHSIFFGNGYKKKNVYQILLQISMQINNFILALYNKIFYLSFGLSVVYFNLIEIRFPKTFSAISPEGSQCKKKMDLFFRQQQIYLTTKHTC
jgi:hypothetical protein